MSASSKPSCWNRAHAELDDAGCGLLGERPGRHERREVGVLEEHVRSWRAMWQHLLDAARRGMARSSPSRRRLVLDDRVEQCSLALEVPVHGRVVDREGRYLSCKDARHPRRSRALNLDRRGQGWRRPLSSPPQAGIHLRRAGPLSSGDSASISSRCLYVACQSSVGRCHVKPSTADSRPPPERRSRTNARGARHREPSQHKTNDAPPGPLRPWRSVRVPRCERKRRSRMANKAIVGEKVGMTQVWDDDNRVVPVTVLQVEPVPGRAGQDHRARRLQRRSRSPSARKKASQAHQARAPATSPRPASTRAPGSSSSASTTSAATRSARSSRSTSSPPASWSTSPPSARARASPAP